jgi:hypothetical protein
MATKGVFFLIYYFRGEENYRGIWIFNDTTLHRQVYSIIYSAIESATAVSTETVIRTSIQKARIL